MPEAAQPLLAVTDLAKHYAIGGGFLGGPTVALRAVDGVSFRIGRGETFGLVGESGCGKSTVGKAILRLVEPTAGSVMLDGVEITSLPQAALREQRRNMQVIFQDPYSSLNPKMTAASIVAEPFRNYRLHSPRERQDRVAALFARVGLRPDQMQRFPHEFSGGQRQRLGIARALALEPKLVIGDEPVSALDVSVQAQVINLMVRLQQELGLSYLFIAHDLGVVRHISDRVGVMYLGRIVETASAATVFAAPAHPYTRMLLSSVPQPSAARGGRRRVVLRGEPPSPLSPPHGCHFHPRCPEAIERCRNEAPVLRRVGSDHLAACHLAGGEPVAA
jgi:peptide/nickel transport system ATP-binding protein/oligopeptide transport system ATP-binding protein